MMQEVKDQALLLQWLGWLLRCRFDSCLGTLHATGMAKKKKQKHKTKNYITPNNTGSIRGQYYKKKQINPKP